MKQFALLVFGAVLLGGVFIVVRNTPLAQLLDPEVLKVTILGYGAYGPLIFMGVYVLACLVFFPVTPLTLLAGVLFGPVAGTVYTVVGATLGASFAFFFSRFFSGSKHTFGTGTIGKRLAQYNSVIESNGFVTVLFLRFVPLFPFNGLNFALGLTRVRTRDYILGTFLGIIPGTTAFVFFGNSLAELSLLKITVAVVAIVALSLLGKLIMKKFTQK